MPNLTLDNPSHATRKPVQLGDLKTADDVLDAIRPGIEPEWRTATRRTAWEHFCALPYPHRKDEKWRFATIERNFLEPYLPAAGVNEATAEAIHNRSNLIGDTAGQIVFGDSTTIEQQELPDSLRQQGVVFKPLAEIADTQHTQIERAMKRHAADLGGAKFEALHQALSQEGVLLYIPRGVIVDEPFVIYNWLSAAKSAIFPHLIVIADEMAEVNLVECFFSVSPDTAGLAISRTQIFAGPGSKVFRKVIQDWSEQTLSFQHDSTFAQRDARVKNVAINLGAHRARFENQVRVEGAGADVKLYSLTVAEKDQEFDQRTLQTHAAPNATSDLLYKNVLLDQSRTIFSGLIKVNPEAQQTDAFQTNRNVLLDPSAEANSLPGLEIEANDVKCSHGATTSRLDDDALFYLRSRGLSERAAKQLLVFGFFEEIIDQIDNEDLAENVRTLVHDKLNQHDRI